MNNAAANVKAFELRPEPQTRRLPEIEDMIAEAVDASAPVGEPERIVRIGEQQGQVMEKVCSALTKQFGDMVAEGERRVAELAAHRDQLIEGIAQLMDDQIHEQKLAVERLKVDAQSASDWIANESRKFAQHATEVAGKLSTMQSRVSAALPSEQQAEGSQ